MYIAADTLKEYIYLNIFQFFCNAQTLGSIEILYESVEPPLSVDYRVQFNFSPTFKIL